MCYSLGKRAVCIHLGMSYFYLCLVPTIIYYLVSESLSIAPIINNWLFQVWYSNQ